MELTVKLQVFEGPLDLLLHLLDKNKVNIYDIPIVEITNQYMEYIREMKRQDLNVMSEFLVIIREGTPRGFSTISRGVPSGRKGMSSSGSTRDTTPLLP